MKKLIFIFLFIFTFLFLCPVPTSAHILKYNGSVGAVLHVNPEDDPIAGETTGFFFEFKDKNNKFLPESCDCVIHITQDGKDIYSQDLFKNNPTPSLTNASFSYTFPSIGIYGVIVEGNPKDGSFDKFILKYDVRVARSATLQASDPTSSGGVSEWLNNHWLHILVPILIFIAFLYFSKKKK